MLNLTTDQFTSILRHILTFVGGYVAAKGWVDAMTLQTIIAAVVAVGTALWGVLTHTDTAKLTAAAAVLEDPAKVKAVDRAVVADVAQKAATA